jgi:hypothetical protein
MPWPLPSGADGCAHLKDFKRRHADGSSAGMENFEKVDLLCAWLRSSFQALRFLRQYEQSPALHCLNCQSHSWLHLCLHCVYIGCFKDARHILAHGQANDHFLSIETTYHQVYCALCKDFVYDAEFHRASEQERLYTYPLPHSPPRCSAAECALPANPSRAPFTPWEPRTKEERDTIVSAISSDRWIDTSTTCGNHTFAYSFTLLVP